ncbi:hypothetical protein M441DRAFT_24753 [Trichoderma asperellum CBS 433.97]|uniref:Transcription activator GCR1-like domain-containing protein n=1 Tax=Trichoderma asperellum (strain ATCC 204424 / CBS 433.97 / NBRC 101777) TaxID=1042311 RepID=A0A2T3ZIJ8_TRIA4|nr:hypothetical protein M441DRAFT_24753 [Trichoderma asperellum CBS 433.97]PTB44620.1 hypothetical protein M441DRAFT_24753 [Trichoderma asperellum CBS 433.97]
MSLLPSPKGLPADPPGDGSNLRGLVRRPGPAPPQHVAAVSGTIAPGFRKKEKKKKKTEKEMLQKVANSSPQSADILDGVPMELARTVVNMQQYYASGVNELAEKLGTVEEELRRAKEENLRMKKRLDMHFGMLGQAAEFMQRVSQGLGMAMPVDEEMLGRKGGDEELKQGFDGDSDLPMEGVNMEVPPMPVDDRPPMRSTGRMAGNRRMMQEKSPAQRRRGKEKRRMVVAAEVLPIREKMVIPQDDGDDDDDDDDNIDRMKKSNSEIRLEEESRHRREDNGSDDAKILQGAPRLQALICQDAIRRSVIRQDITRQSRFTPINRVPSRQSTPSVDNDADSDEYCPSSPSSSSSSDSIYEEETAPSSTIAISKPTPSPNHLLQTPLPASSSSSSSTSTSSRPSKPRYSVTRRTTIPRYASGPPGKPFRFHRMGRTVLDVWTEYKRGSKGNPAIEALERQYGTEWRTGEDTRELKYASNYVSVRQKVVSQVEEMCEREGISAMEACRRLDERVDGRMQLLISAVRKGQDPFVVIPKR